VEDITPSTTPPPPAAADYPEAIHIQREDSSKVRNMVRCGVNIVKRNQGDWRGEI
jgi:hypothetical protein